MAYPMDTPSRVLRRVQQMEDVELPSLPSIEHGLDYETASEAETSLEASQRSRRGLDESDMATPHPLRQTFKPRESASSLTSTTHTDHSSVGSPFPPNAASDSSVDLPSKPATSTPTTLQSRVSRSNLTVAVTERGFDLERTKSSHSLKSSTGTGKEKWHTPGELSASFSGDEISPEGSFEGADLEEQVVPLNDTSLGRDRSFSRPLTETPYTLRLSNGNVLHQRPGKRASSNMFRVAEPGKAIGALSPTSASTGTTSTPHSHQTAVHLPTAGRIPSLTHSEQSETDASEQAGTPEPTSVEMSLRATPQQEVSRHLDESLGEASRSITEVADFELPSLPSLAVNAANEIDLTSPAKPSPSEIMSTPGIGRLQSPRHVSQYTNQQTPYAPSPLSDITASHRNSPSSIPFTPSPTNVLSKGSDFSTPRAPLNDAERRKNHVLAVLSSTEMPSRKTSVRRTPHPLRRVSIAHESVTSSGSAHLRSTIRSASETFQIGDHSRIQTANDSFVSIASSADLTSDHRASRIRGGAGRSNTSFSTILLPTGKNTSGGSLKGLSEARADGVKIHRHLNAMNKQLLQTNAGLAREAEAWRDEVDRLMDIMRQAGVEFEEVDVLANLSVQMDQAEVSQLDAIPERLRQRSRDNSGVYSSLAAHAQEPNIQAEMDDIPGMPDLLAERLELVEAKRNKGEPFPAGAFLEGLSDEDRLTVIQEFINERNMLEDLCGQKVELIKDLRQELDVAQGFGSTEHNSSAGTQLRLDELTHKLEDADKERASMQASFAQRTEEHAKKFGEICTGFEEQVASLEKELASAKSEVERLRTEKDRLESLHGKDSQGEREVELRKQLGEVVVELKVATEASQARAVEVERLKQMAQASQDEKVELLRKVELAEDQLAEAENQLQAVEEELRDAKAQSEERQNLQESTNNPDAERSHGLESINAQLEDELVQQDKDIQELSDKVAELQADLDAVLDEREDADALRAEIERLSRLVVEVEDELAERDGEIEALRGKANLSQTFSNGPHGDGQGDHVAQLENELEDAFKEIGRLKHELGSTPHRKSIIDMRDMRIQSLEREKAVLQERLANARDASMGMKAAASPFKATPMLRKAPSMKHLTPGPIMEMSWLHTTIGDANEAALRNQMEYLQQELDAANNQLDANFTRLEAAGLNGLNLAERLAQAQDRVAELEAELKALQIKGKSIDARKTSEQAEHVAVETRLKAALKSVNDQLKTVRADYAAEQDRLQGDNARLRDFVTEVRAKSDAKFDQVLGEMERMQADSEATVKRLTSEKAKIEGEVGTLQRELQSSSSKLRQLERDLQDQRNAYDTLALQQSNPADPAGTKVNSVKIQQLERTLRDLRSTVTQLESSLDDRTTALSAAQERLATMKRERQTTANEVLAFERDLRAQQKENREFGLELSRLRNEQAGSVSRHKAELDTLRRDLRTAREAYQRSERDLSDMKRDHASLQAWKVQHEGEVGVGVAMEGQKMRFKAQSRELAAQVKYLKAKFTREATFRNALAIQKRYLLLLVGGYSLNEHAILKQIASMGFPVPDPPRPKRTLKAVAIAVVGIIRARNAAGQWRRERRLKNEAVEAYNDRKRDGL